MIIKKNARLTVEIQDVTAKGFGVCHQEGLALFIDGGLPGDRLLIQIVKVKTRYAYGKILEIITSSPARIKSPCSVSDKCGGCQWQHCRYETQLEFKKRIVTDTIERIGGIANPPVADVIGMEKPFRYRNKALFPTVPVGKNDFAIGMYAPRSHRIVEVADCLIQHESHIKILAALKEHMRRKKITAYDEATHKGLMRHIMIRTSRNEIMVVLVINGSQVPGESELADSFANLGVSTSLVNCNEAKGNVVLGEKFRVLRGRGYIYETLGELRFQLSPGSFFQVNPIQAKVLYDIAVSQAGLDGNQSVIDAHCGVGGVALYAASRVQQIIGVDIVPAAIQDAEKNAALNNISNARFILGAAEDIIPGIIDGGEGRLIPEFPLHPKSTIVFLDPPRKGCDPVLLDALVAARIQKIVYISCDPATLARDIKRLVSGGYKLTAVQPVDMFPFTGKVETSCLLEMD